MERVLVLGCCGAGKTQLSLQLGKRLGAPVVHLDRLHFGPGWVVPDREQFAEAQRRSLPAGARWIADGNYASTLELRLELADTVVFLDAPTPLCLWRVFSRTLAQLGRVRPDQAPGCPERLFHRDYLSFLGYVATFNRRRRPLLLDKLRSFPRLWVLEPHQVDGFLSTLPSVAHQAIAD